MPTPSVQAFAVVRWYPVDRRSLTGRRACAMPVNAKTARAVQSRQ